MNIYDLECFLALVRYLNFTKAAEYMHISQPAFSRHISTLENELDAPLFFRNKRFVFLTKAGEVFLPEAEASVAHYYNGVALAKKAAAGTMGLLRIGTLEEQNHQLMPGVIQTFRTKYPSVEISFSELSHTAIIAALQNYEIDIAFTINTGLYAIGDADLSSDMSFEFTVIMHHNHPLAAREAIQPSELIDESFILFDPQAFSFINEITIQLCRSNGFAPQVTKTASSITGLLMLVACGEGVSIVPHHFRQQYPSEVNYVKLCCENLPESKRVMAWRRSNTNPCLPLFIQATLPANPPKK